MVTERGPGLPLYPVASGQANTFRAYVEAIRGERYSIRVRNHSPYRVGLVIAVDGRNIISGKKSFLQPQERMYILDPHGWGYYDGWRSSNNQVNTFYFTDAGGLTPAPGEIIPPWGSSPWRLFRNEDRRIRRSMNAGGPMSKGT